VAVTLIRTIRDLQRRRARERRGQALIEGVRLVEEALEAGLTMAGAAVAPGLESTSRGQALQRRLRAAAIPLEQVSDADLTRLADTDQPQGVVAVVEPPVWDLTQLRMGTAGVVLVLDAVQDPGNVGALARTALGLGAVGLLTLPGTADLLNPKVLRGSMGALFRLPAIALEVEELLRWSGDCGVALWATGPDGTPASEVVRQGPVAVVVGNEGSGVRPALVARADQVVSVPLQGGVESLNVAVAAGIILHEVLRAH
jgi:TrmH family RNA methyltransferase